MSLECLFIEKSMSFNERKQLLKKIDSTSKRLNAVDIHFTHQEVRWSTGKRNAWSLHFVTFRFIFSVTKTTQKIQMAK